MQRALALYQSSIGKKVAMALSGMVIAGFSVGHLLGNLNAYLGEQAFNDYAATLHSMPALVWGTRIVLLASFTMHIVAAFKVVMRNWDARPSRYHATSYQTATPASRSMAISGTALALFLVFHLLHFTLMPELFNEAHANNPYWNFYVGMTTPVTAALYMFGNLALGVHLFHGFFSAFQTLGANHPKYNMLRRYAAVGIAVLVAGGNIMFAAAGLSGVFREPQGHAVHSHQVAQSDAAH